MAKQESPLADHEDTDQELKRTTIFAAVAVVCLLITGTVHWVGSPGEIEEFGRVGETFYPKFIDPTEATALEVFTVNSKDARAMQFRVEQKENGRWVIPSHHDYPADAKEQLAKTAASILGIKRGAMVTRWKADHAKYGVVNPKQTTITVSDVEGIGKRLILEGKGGDVLADFVVGNRVEDSTNQYYVRHPDEEEVYITDLDIDLTTKFADWIDTDLFDIQSVDIVNIELNDYTIDEINGTISKSELTIVHRDKSADPWKMDDLIEEKDEVNTDAVNDTLNAIRDLKIAGVRPKQKGLTPELRIDRTALKSQRDFGRLQNDLLNRGFILQPGPDGDPNRLLLIARDGEMKVATDDGLVYAMFFGRVFTGSDEELEIGFGNGEEAQESKTDSADNSTSEQDEAVTTETDQAEADQDGSDEDGSDEDGSDEDGSDEDGSDEDDEQKSKSKPGRYVFVRVFFDKRFLGEDIVEPTEPEQPAELKDAPPSVEGEDDPLEEIRDKYSDDQVAYQADKRSHEEYLEKIKDGLKKADELNLRFVEWYYVISGEEYDKLKLDRADYIREKTSEDDEEVSADGAAPGLSIPGNLIPGGVELPVPPSSESDSVTEPSTDASDPVQPEVKPAPESNPPTGPEKPAGPTEDDPDPAAVDKTPTKPGENDPQ
jgi:hypothetical protein